MPRTVVAIGGCEDGTRFCPASTQGRVTAAIPSEQTQTVLSSPAVASGVGEIGLAAVVYGSRAFHDGCTVLLPTMGWCRKDLRDANLSRRRKLCDTERLQFVGHAGPDKIIAPAAEADDAAVDTPGIG